MGNKPIKSLMELPEGVPLDSAFLKKVGISPALASHYAEAGYLQRLARGVYKRPRGELNLDESIRFLNRADPELHVGGKTALSWHGLRRQVGEGKPVILWGAKSRALPRWFATAFKARYLARKLFDEGLSVDFALSERRGEEVYSGVLVSEPERALFELLSEVGPKQGLEEVREIMEQLRRPRLEVLEKLIKHCGRIKVVRLCVTLAEELELDWALEARQFAGVRGRGRWFGKLPDGSTLILKP